MKRNIINDLVAWKKSAGRKPLVLKGARQVGKTWALMEFGKKHYGDKGYRYHYIDMREAKALHSIFKETFDPASIIKYLQFELKISIDPVHDLLVLDEI